MGLVEKGISAAQVVAQPHRMEEHTEREEVETVQQGDETMEEGDEMVQQEAHVTPAVPAPQAEGSTSVQTLTGEKLKEAANDKFRRYLTCIDVANLEIVLICFMAVAAVELALLAVCIFGDDTEESSEDEKDEEKIKEPLGGTIP